MNNDYTHISIVLDRSGSMSSIKDDTIGGINSFIEKQKELKGKCTLSLYQFDDKFDTIKENVDIQSIEHLTDKTYIPRGNTALLDAFGKVIDLTGNFLKNLPEKDRPAKVIICVITDGQENSSKIFSIEKIKSKVLHQREKYNWQFVFLGANMDAITVAGSFGISKNSTLTYAATSDGIINSVNAFGELSAMYRSASLDTDLNSISFSEKARKEQKLN